ncbi:MAG TPA: hypothetical protein VIG61_06005 [Fusobacterium sp.]|uniref:hypothetical protein n=1 Tax=Fusobacterium sp. TaxID=68766 RepID=UPI002F4179DA
MLLRRSHNRKAFSFLEITMGFSIFLMLLSCFYPSLHLFYKSYVKVRKLSLIEREQQDLERLIKHLYAHRFPHLSSELPSFFVIRTDNITFIEVDVNTLRTLITEEGDILMIQCVFRKEKDQYVEKTFVLRFFQNQLRLENYKNGYFKTGEGICIVTNVQGHFSLKDSMLCISYSRRNENKKYENCFYISP